MLTTALCKLCTPSSVTQSPPPRSLHDHSSSLRACVTFVLIDVLSSTRWKPFCSSPIVFTPMRPDIAPDSPDSCSGRGPLLAPGSPAVRKRKPRRLRQEGAVGVAFMTSDTHGLWHADVIRSAAARPRGVKSASGVLGHVLTRWRLASPTLAGTRHLACTSWSAIDCNQQAPSAVLPLAQKPPRTRTTSMQTMQRKTKEC